MTRATTPGPGQFAVIDDTKHQTDIDPTRHRKAARVLIAAAIDHEGIDVRLVRCTAGGTCLHPAFPVEGDKTRATGIVRHIAEALGLTPTPPPTDPAQRHGESGWARDRHRKATQKETTTS